MPQLISVIIPTCNRARLLKRVLAALAEQTHPADATEIIVVDDGSSDDTAMIVADSARSTRLRLHFQRQRNAGPASARNAGIQMASHPLLVFLGDDTIPTRDFLERHEQYHRAYNNDGALAVVGYTTWPAEMRTTPFMRFAGEHGPQFGYARMRPRISLPHHRFYTSNLSFSRELIKSLAHPFDIDFPSAMWEDTELAYRLSKRGMVLHYLPEAVAYHDHPTDIAASCRRFREVGRLSRLVLAKHPELVGELHGDNKLKWISRLASPVRALVPFANYLDSSLRIPLPFPLYWLLLGEAYARGATSFVRPTTS